MAPAKVENPKAKVKAQFKPGQKQQASIKAEPTKRQNKAEQAALSKTELLAMSLDDTGAHNARIHKLVEEAYLL